VVKSNYFSASLLEISIIKHIGNSIKIVDIPIPVAITTCPICDSKNSGRIKINIKAINGFTPNNN